ncbi:sugar transferase [Lactiplantibacillus songbeiensis]|uniref:Sugar transferase n=2 Tax=Lactiplantibacillus songbeiensis TaxID=2559920 RepID=A0ABW4C1Y8_9LACO|nr:sugar transferase [Lactiplantibacillus songbeiensis]
MLYQEKSEMLPMVNPIKLKRKLVFFAIKRLFDIVASLCGMIILSPLLLIIAICIKVNDPQGGVIYSQVRLGKNKKKFRMYKFRSMYIDADERLKDLLKYNEVDGAMFKIKDDPRVTSVGRVIRKYSIDELPQLWNVFKGDMSLVGPRPPLEREVEQYSDYDLQRLLVKPGCTGLWQVGDRNAVGFDDMVQLDIKYIRHISVLQDLSIMVRTVYIMIVPNTAS